MQKNARAFFPHISMLCSSKRPAKKSDLCRAHVLLFFFHHMSMLCSSESPAKKVTYVECTCFPFFSLISVHCAVLKDPPQKKMCLEMQKKPRALSFFSSYQYVVQFEKTRQKELRMWSARSSLFFP